MFTWRAGWTSYTLSALPRFSSTATRLMVLLIAGIGPGRAGNQNRGMAVSADGNGDR